MPRRTLCSMLFLIATSGLCFGCMQEPTFEEIAPGVYRKEIGVFTEEGAAGKIWLYRPEPIPDQALALIVVPPAGGDLVSAPALSYADEPEHIPYVQAGHAVVSFTMRGERGALGNPDEDILAFKAGRAGVDDAVAAINLALAELPINEDRIYAAGHSSAGTLALLLALEDKRIDGVIAYAPVTDVLAHLGEDNVDAVTQEILADFRAYVEWSSPLARVDEFALPMFLFIANDDPTIDLADYQYFISKTGDEARVFSEVVKASGHYQPMIDFGIPKALQWIDTQTSRSVTDDH